MTTLARSSSVALLVLLVGPGVFGCSAPASSLGAGKPDADAGRADARHDVGPVPAPALTALSVVSAAPVDGSTPLSLVPPFSPTIHDYYVRCSEGANHVTVSMTAARGSETELIEPTTSPKLRAQTLSLTVNENEAIVAAATDAGATTSYWVRCVPHDFPQLRMSNHPAAGSPPAGYYLVGDFLPPASQGSYAMVLDGNGVPVWYVSGAPGGMGDVDHVVSGAISFIAFGASMAPFDVRHIDPPSTALEAPSGALLDGHELQLAPGGHYVVLSNPVETGVDLKGVVIPGADGGVQSFGPGSSIQGCDIVEFDPATLAVTWTWVGSEHLDPVKDSTLPALATFGVSGPDGGLVVDPFHCNSIDVDPANGNLLVSARNTDSIFYVERSTGAILWKLGGATYTKDGATLVTMDDPFFRQHDARLLPGWSSSCAGGRGQISVFDDESQRPAPARGVIYDVVVGAPDGGTAGCADGGPAGKGIVAWQHAGTVSSTGIGSFRVSPDGSRVIGWGFGVPNLVFTEVDAQGNDLRDFEFPDGNSSYRAIKVPLTALDLDAMRRTTGLP
jgi:hypothetical protein